MTNLDTLTRSVEQLSPEDLAKFSTWFAEFKARLWDEQIEHDAKTGKFDKLVDKWRADHRAGKATDL